MRPFKGLTFSRKIVTASKAWPCDALCGQFINPAEDYVLDTVFDGVATNASLRSHLRCAVFDRKVAKELTMTYFNEVQKSMTIKRGGVRR